MLKSKKNKISQIILNSFIIILCAFIVLPLILVVSVSLSKESDIAKYGYLLIPKNVDLSAYKYVFNNPSAILQSYVTTITFSTISMVLSVVFMAMMAYPLTKTYLKGKTALSFYLYFTMLFSGGLVPTYILNTQYFHLNDTLWIYILPGLISPWYVFMMRTFFQGLPESIVEAAYIDGASEYKIFFIMVLPLSKPVLAAVALFVFLGHWNDWYTSMLYINKENLVSLQYLLQRIMLKIDLLQQNPQAAQSGLISVKDIPTETVRMVMTIVVAGPALVIFPFFQKYFVKGLTVGSVKG